MAISFTATKTFSLLSIFLPLLLSFVSSNAVLLPAAVAPTQAFPGLSCVTSLARVPVWNPYQAITPYYNPTSSSPYIYNQFVAVPPYYHAYSKAFAAPFFNQLQANHLFNQLQSNQLFNQQQANQLFQHQQANLAFNQLEANQLLNQLQTNQAFYQQQANQLFWNAQPGNYLTLPSSVFAYPAAARTTIV